MSSGWGWRWSLACLLVSGCSAAQVQQDSAAIAKGVQVACGDVQAASSVAAALGLQLIPEVATIAAFGAAECGTAEAATAMVAKAAADPTIVAQIEGIAGNMKAAIAKLRSVVKPPTK